MTKDEWATLPNKESLTFQISGVRSPAQIVSVHKMAAVFRYRKASNDEYTTSYCPCEMVEIWGTVKKEVPLEPRYLRRRKKKYPPRKLPYEFDCATCGKHVVVSDRHDMRKRYCSSECGKVYKKKGASK